MSDVLILKNGKPVKRVCQKYELLNTKFDIQGFLTKFKNLATQIEYEYVSKSDFLEIDQKSPKLWISGYCEINKFTLYKRGEISLAKLKWKDKNNGNWEINGLNDNWFDLNFKSAEENDEANVSPVIINSPYNKYFLHLSYSFNIEKDNLGKIKNYDRDNNGVLDNIPQISAQEVDRLDGTIDGGFYKNHIINNINFNSITDDVTKRNLAELCTKISFKIFWICNDIFPLLSVNELENSTIINLVNGLKFSWKDEVVIEEFNYQNFLDYYNSLNTFYKVTKYKDFSGISSNEKLILLSRILPSSVLKDIFSYNELIIILTSLFTKLMPNNELKLVKINLDSSDEEFAIKIINSLDVDNQTDVDGFMEALYSVGVKTNSQSPPFSYSLFSLLYEGINDSPKPIKAFAELTGDKVSENRKRLMTALLYIWDESKYNPNKNINYTFFETTYTYSTNYKPPIIKYINKSANLGLSKHLFGMNNNPIISFPFESFGKGIYWIIENSLSSELSSDSAYHLYQPISIISYPSETDTSLALPKKGSDFNGGIPIFYIKYINDSNNEDEFWDKVGFVVDVASTFAGVGVVFKLRYLRHLSKLGQVGVIIGSVQFVSGVINLILNHAEFCDDSPFCRKLRTLLTFLELSALISDPIILFKTKKAAREVVEEGIESGWPSGMLDEIDNTTPKNKIIELANQDISDYISQFITKSKSKLVYKLNADKKYFTKIYNDNPLIIPPGDEISELMTIAAGKGLSSDDIAGIIHQASRKRVPPYKASISELSQRMDNIILVRRRGYPFPFTSKIQFDTYVNEKIIPTLDKFGLPKNNVYIGGSGVTSQTSLSGGIQDTDWIVYFSSKTEEKAYVNKLLDKFDEMSMTTPKILTNKEAKKYKEGLLEDYAKTGQIHKRYIVAIENGKKINLYNDPAKSQNFIVDFFGTTKTDITPKVFGYNNNIPQVKINIE